MKSYTRKLLAALTMLALLSTINYQLSTAFAQGTAFTYQGQLQSGGALANGTYNLQFLLYTNSSGGTAVAGPVTTNGVVISNGLFTLTTDFGASVWNGETNWLEIGVETNGGGTFTTLSPRQELTPAPYSIFAEGSDAAGLSGAVPTGGLSGTYTSQVSFNNPSNSFTGNGAGLTNVNASTLGGLGSSTFWQLGGNNPAAGSQIVGTLNNQPLDLFANGVRALRLILRTDASGVYSNAPNVIGGSSVNLVKTGVVGGTVSGGGGNDTNGVSYPNQVNADFGTISGGLSNAIASAGVYSFIGGGQGNTASQSYGTVGGGLQNAVNNLYATVGGGILNSASGLGTIVGGGYSNTISGNGPFSTVTGGANNTVVYGNGSFIGGGGYDGVNFSGNVIQDSAAVIGGGVGNSISSGGRYSVIGGGNGNSAGGIAAVVGGGQQNLVSGAGSFIGGGGFDGTITSGNSISDNAAVIGGGLVNSIASGGVYSFIGGGTSNTVSAEAAVIGGGTSNTASAEGAVVGGGEANLAKGVNSTVAGGQANQAKGDFSAVAGGFNNLALGVGSFIGGGGYDGNIYGTNRADGNASVISGGVSNIVFPVAIYGFIGGGLENTVGGSNSVVGGGFDNQATGTNCIVAGGRDNHASANYAVIAGGKGNQASADYAVIAGGEGNFASGTGSFVGGGGYDGFAPGPNTAAAIASSVAGGEDNTVYSAANYGCIGGGSDNQVDGICAVIGGGDNNDAFGQDATIPGGYGNYASGAFSFAAGNSALATNDDSFVWSDGSGSTGDTAPDQFVARASGGFFFYTDSTSSGATLASGSGSWSIMSDRNAKENFKTVNAQSVLAQVAAMPVTTWNYKSQDEAIRHIGPMAQDFRAAFGMGENDTTISTVDEGGVALAAIQGLNEKVEAGGQKSEAGIQKAESQIEKLEQTLELKETEITELKARLEKLEQIIGSKTEVEEK